MTQLHYMLAMLSLCIFSIKAGNDTDTTTSPPNDISTTQMYTTLPALTATDDPFDPTDDTECLFEFVATLFDAEDIDVSLCGYIDNSNTKMIGISLQIPPLRWFSIGYISNSDYDETDSMKNVYSIVIDPSTYPRSVNEYYNGDMLESTVSVISDNNVDGYRYIKLTRKVTLSLSDVSDQNQGVLQFPNYFDFAMFDDCDDSIKVVWAFGQNDNERFVGHQSNEEMGTIDAYIDSIGGISCDSLEDESKGIKASMIGVLMVLVLFLLK